MGAPRDKQERRAALARKLTRSDSISLTIQAKHSGVATEDEDSAPCQQLTVTPKKKVMCVLWDNARHLLWVGDDDGHVCAYSITNDKNNVGSGGSTSARSTTSTSSIGDDSTVKRHTLRYKWQAHRMGHISALSLGPTGDLWTASSRGTIRIWTPEEQQPYNASSVSSSSKGGVGSTIAGAFYQQQQHSAPTCRELRRGPNNERPHSSAVAFMKCTTDGQIMWSASTKNILLWDAHSGMFLGTLYRQGKKNLALRKKKVVVPSSGQIEDISEEEGEKNDVYDDIDTTNNNNNNDDGFGSPVVVGGSGTLPVDAVGTTTTTTTNYSPGMSMASSSSLAQGNPAPLLPALVVDASVGLAVDKTTGAVLARPNCTERRELRSLQESWASATDAAVRELVERVAHGGGKVVAGAKKAGKFLMKVVGKVSGDAALQQQKEKEQSAAGEKLALEGGGGRQGSGGFSTSGLLVDELEYLTPRGGGGGGDEYGYSTTISSFNSTMASSAAALSTGMSQSGGVGMILGNIQGIEPTTDNCIWVAYRNGHIERYSGTGKLLSWTTISPPRDDSSSISGGGGGMGGSFIGGRQSGRGASDFGGSFGNTTGTGSGGHHMSEKSGMRIQTIVAVGDRVWIGTADGRILIYDSSDSSSSSTSSNTTASSASSLLLLKEFIAHPATILSMTTTYSRVYSLAADGAIKGWSCHLPTPTDLDALVEWRSQAPSVVSYETMSMLCVTWNVGESRPAEDAEFFRHLASHSGMRGGGGGGGSRNRLWSGSGSGGSESGDIPTQLSQSGRLLETIGKDLVIVCLQEVEMGSTSVALAAYKDALSSKLQEQGNVNARFWSQRCLTALGSGEGATNPHFRQIGLRQLSGMLVMVFARSNLNTHIGEVATASVACGVLGVGGNKGAVAVEFTLHRRKFAAVCSHFAAHQGAVEARNAHYATIVNRLRFSKPPAIALTGSNSGDVDGGGQQQHTASASTASMHKPKQHSIGGDTKEVPLIRGDWSDDDDYEGSLGDMDGSVIDDDMFGGAGGNREENDASGANQIIVQREGTRSAEVLIWAGDFNYRIDGIYQSVKMAAQGHDLGPLLEADQLRKEVHAGRVFKGLKEGEIKFKPTYKFDKGAANPTAYDSSEKRRVPAWCDRVFFRGTPQYKTPDPAKLNYVRENEEELIKNPDDVHVRLLQYDCWPDVIDSDHKPVFASLEADLPVTDQHRKRTICADIMEKYYHCTDNNNNTARSSSSSAAAAARVSLSSNEAKLHPTHMPSQAVLLKNESKESPVLFRIVPSSIQQWTDDDDNNNNTGISGGGEWMSDGGHSGPIAVDVWPMAGVIPPGEELAVHLSASIDTRAVIPGGGATKRVFKVVSWAQEGGRRKQQQGKMHYDSVDDDVQLLTAIVLQEYAYQDKY